MILEANKNIKNNIFIDLNKSKKITLSSKKKEEID